MGEEIYQHWVDDERVKIVHFLDDLDNPPIQYGPTSCVNWGKAETIDIPPIIDDGALNTVFNWFENPNGTGIYPLIVFINHELVINRIMGTSPSPTMANLLIENMLNNCSEGFDCNGNCGGTDVPAFECSGGGLACNENACLNLAKPTDRILINNFNLTRLYPNPFNPILNIDFEINQAGWVNVNITDITGSMVKTVYEGFEGVGKHQISWDSETLPSGTYFVTFEFENLSLTKKVVLLK